MHRRRTVNAERWESDGLLGEQDGQRRPVGQAGDADARVDLVATIDRDQVGGQH